jgi:hypothetical protein
VQIPPATIFHPLAWRSEPPTAGESFVLLVVEVIEEEDDEDKDESRWLAAKIDKCSHVSQRESSGSGEE